MAPDDGYPDYGTFDGFTAGGNARFTYYNPDGSEYSTVICPYCGYEHSMATNCPNCGGGYT
jgi:rubrerythrin